MALVVGSGFGRRISLHGEIDIAITATLRTDGCGGGCWVKQIRQTEKIIIVSLKVSIPINWLINPRTFM